MSKYHINRSLLVRSRSEQTNSDLSQVSQILSSTDESFQSHSISDSFRLGKFSIDRRRPRPILVKLLRSSDFPIFFRKEDLLPSPTPSSRIYLWKNGNENLPSSRKDGLSSSQVLSVSSLEYTTFQFSSTTSCMADLISPQINFIAVLP